MAIACRLRKLRGTEIVEPCRVCGIARRPVLRLHSFLDGTATLCANHSALAGKRRLTLGAFLDEMAAQGDRRSVLERRLGLERRTSAERREFSEPVEQDGRERERRAG
jgi:hypothetical protein